MDWLRELSSALGFPEKIGAAVFNILYSTGTRLLNVEEEAGRLRRTEERIRALLTDAEQRRFVDHDSVKLWLRELRAAAFDVDTLLDRLNTVTAVSRMAAEPSRKRKRPWPSIELGPRQRWELDGKITKINERLEEINKARKNYMFRAGDARRTAQPMQRPSTTLARLVYGDPEQRLRYGWSSSDCHDLELIGRRIAENCHGSPLAAKSLGVLLSDTNGQREQWESIISEMQILEDDKNKNTILPSLQIGYQHLPYHLKRCFAFCSILPLGVEFEKDELVRLWMADGLVKSTGRKRVEMEANRSFDELLWRSFFENSHSFPNQKFRVADHPEWIRYATILCPKDGPLAFDKIYQYENLRLLKLCPMMKLPSEQVPSALFSKLTCLRALDMSYTELDVLPDSVGCLMHLRYLSLRNTLIKTLPEAVCNLTNLQTLDLRNCYWLMDLPEGMSRLVNMRHLCLHLDWDRVTAFRSMPSGIDKLESLQTLCRFVVVSSDGGNCNLSELRNLGIRGELCILKLEAATHDGAEEANLNGKEYLQKLMLKWSDGTCPDEQQLLIEESEKIVEALCPHTNLKHLRIDNYPGRDLPSWVQRLLYVETLEIVSCPRLTQFSVEMLRSLRNIRIHQCADLAVLPRGLCNLEGLHCLEIDGAPNLKRISAVDILPRNISRLVVSGCNALERWCVQEGAEIVQQIPDQLSN
ncbi:hypothetical protein ACP70R_017272 [Stipagrostis hirtigluma subsp. patula]